MAASARGRSLTEPLQTRVRWVLQHGLVRLLLARAARDGDPQALMIMDPVVRSNPVATQERVRAGEPLVRGRLTWVTASHEVCRDVLRSPDFAVGGTASALPAGTRRLGRWAADPHVLGPIDRRRCSRSSRPDHTRCRRLVATVLTARAVERLRPDVQQIADELLDESAALPSDEPFDLVSRYVTQLPVRVIARLLGVPASASTVGCSSSATGWRRASTSVWAGGSTASCRTVSGVQPLARRPPAAAARPSWQRPAQPAGGRRGRRRRLDDVELRSTAGLLLAAGFETTVNLLGNGARLLVEAPEQLARLRAEPSGWADAVEEVLRYDSPVQVTGQMAVRDTEVAGRSVARGQHVTTLLAAANRDPEVFAEPHRFDVTRANVREHLAFSGGRHFCLGAALARVEGEVALAAPFDRFPRLALLPGAVRRPTRVLRRWAHLPATTGGITRPARPPATPPG